MVQNEMFSLLLRIRGGEDEAFSLLTDTYRGLLEGLVRSFSEGLCAADSEELSQEARLALYRAACTYKPSREVTFGLYARVCVRNALVSFLRRTMSREDVALCSIDELLLSDENEPALALIAAERLTELMAKVKEVLSPYEHRVFTLLLEQRSHAAIAAALGKSEKSVANAVFRLKDKLRVALTDL